MKKPFRLRLRVQLSLPLGTQEKPSSAADNERKPLLHASDNVEREKAYVPVPYCFCDFLMACRCAYYCYGQSIISDAQYDSLEAYYVKHKLYQAPDEERGKELLFPGSDKRFDYTPAEKALALYLIFRFTKRDQVKNRKLNKRKIVLVKKNP